MARDIIDDVVTQQRSKKFLKATEPTPQDPEMLYIGCVDARLDPVADIGIEQGRALIYRNIGALVQPPSEKSANGAVTARDSIGAVLELFLDLMERQPPKGRPFTKKHIVVSGHTHCGGINCACGKTEPKTGGPLARYLSAFTDAVADMLGIAGRDISDTQLRDLEKKSVCQSVINLESYPIVKEAMGRGMVELHGWIIDTATKHISEWNKETNEFVPLDQMPVHREKKIRSSGEGFSSPNYNGRSDRTRG